MGRLASLQQNEYDLAIIGGGIIGCGLARDVAARGLRVALVEMGDFGQGTSSGSTRLIHGGLRYLALLDFGLVRQDLREREILLRLAPHLVRPLPFLVPVYRRGAAYGLKLRLGMLLYDLLSYDKSLPPHRWLSPAQVLAAEPALSPAGLEGAFLYYDAQASFVERLCLENVLSAQEHGAQVANHARATGLLWQAGQVAGLAVRDETTGEAVSLKARLVVNATGPWLDSTLGLIGRRSPPLLRRTKGVHLVLPRATRHALVLFAQDGRLFFVVPWHGFSLVGTTDTDFEGDPGLASTAEDDVRYLLASVRPVLPGEPWDRAALHYAMAGVRALVRAEGVSESAVSRKHAIVEHGGPDGAPGLISVAGGKITAYRGIAQEVGDLVCRRLGRARTPTRTDREPLPGARFASLGAWESEVGRAGARLGLAADQCRYLVGLYGSRALAVLALVERSPHLGQRLSPTEPDILAQVRHAVEQELALTVEDFLLRRSMLGFARRRGVACLRTVAAEMGSLLGWDEARRRAEEDGYLEHVRQTLPTGLTPGSHAAGKQDLP